MQYNVQGLCSYWMFLSGPPIMIHIETCHIVLCPDICYSINKENIRLFKRNAIFKKLIKYLILELVLLSYTFTSDFLC